jgi:ABC-type sugar transport system substrate-binding protein
MCPGAISASCGSTSRASPQIHTLGTAALSYVNDNAPETVENTVSVDGVTGNLSSDTAYNLVVATVPNYGKDYWIIFTPFDDYAIGAPREMESLGKADNTAITTRGGTAICAMWDTGEQNSIKSALFVAATIVTEYNVAGLWAMMSGLRPLKPSGRNGSIIPRAPSTPMSTAKRSG